MANVDEAVEMYLGGASLAQIKAELGTHAPALYAELDRRGIPRRRKLVPVTGPKVVPERKYIAWRPTEEEVREILDLFNKGMTGVQIAELKGKPYSKVLKVLRDARVQLVPGRSSRKWANVQEDIRKDVLNGVALNEIINKYGITASALNNLIKGRLQLRKADFDRPEFYETIINELMLRLQEQFGVVMHPDNGAVQLKLF